MTVFAFDLIGIIKNNHLVQSKKLDAFLKLIGEIRNGTQWSKENILDAFNYLLPDFSHEEKNHYLDEKM